MEEGRGEERRQAGREKKRKKQKQGVKESSDSTKK